MNEVLYKASVNAGAVLLIILIGFFFQFIWKLVKKAFKRDYKQNEL